MQRPRRLVVYLVRFLLFQAVLTAYLVLRQFMMVYSVEGEEKFTRTQPTPSKQIRSTLPYSPSKADVEHRRPVKILLVSYMRGGSTLLGEIFNQNPSATYWFESLDGAYAALYGLEFGIRTHEITHHVNRTARVPPLFEQEYIADITNRLLSCEVGLLPLEVVQHPFLVRGRQRVFREYAQCVSKLLGTKVPQFCRKLDPLCKRKTRLHNVDLCAQAAKDFLVNATKQYQNFPSLKVAQKLQEHIVGRHSSQRCYKALQKARSLCWGHMEKGCDATFIRAVKSVRLTMENVEKILQKIPDVKVIHMLRDPRAVAASRANVGLLSEQSFRNKALESKMLCDLIRRDMDKRKQLETKYPDTFIVLTYEYFAEHPIEVAQAIYNKLQLPLPQVVSDWLYNSTHATSDGDSFKTNRRNSSATALSWMSSITKQELYEIGLFCVDLYDRIAREGIRHVG